MAQLLQSILDQVRPTTLIDIGITALLIYWLFSLIRGTRAVRLVIGVSVLFLVYAAAQALGLRLLSQILQTGAVVGVFALVVVFQPELRRALVSARWPGCCRPPPSGRPSTSPPRSREPRPCSRRRATGH